MASNPTKSVRDLLLWARKERIILSSVSVGGVTVEIERDFGMTLPTGTTEPPAPRMNIIEQHAGALLPALRGENVVVEEVNEPTEEDD